MLRTFAFIQSPANFQFDENKIRYQLFPNPAHCSIDSIPNERHAIEMGPEIPFRFSNESLVLDEKLENSTEKKILLILKKGEKNIQD